MAKKEGFYKIGSGLEPAAVYYILTDRRFGGDTLPHIQAKGFEDETARLLIDAASQVYTRTGTPPESSRMVYAQIEAMIEKGQVTRKQLRAAKDLMFDVCDAPPRESAEAMSDILLAKIKRHSQKAALEQMSNEFVKGGDLSVGQAKMDKANSIGRADTTIGTRVRADLVDIIRRAQKLKRARTGIQELDLELKGGLRENSMACFVGGSGSGKSMALLHSMCANAARGHICALATIGELSWEEQYVRAIANMTGVSSFEMEHDDDAADEAAEIIDEIVHLKKFGMITIKEFPDGVTVSDIKDWLANERNAGLEVQSLYIDYADKMGWKGSDGSYEGMKKVYSGLRELMRSGTFAGSLRWVWTASQIRADDKEASDSKWKKQLVDMMIKITFQEETEGEELCYDVWKNRHGTSGFKIEDVPHDWERGRMCTPTWPDYWPV